MAVEASGGPGYRRVGWNNGRLPGPTSRHVDPQIERAQTEQNEWGRKDLHIYKDPCGNRWYRGEQPLNDEQDCYPRKVPGY